QAHRDNGVNGDRAREHAMLPAQPFEALAEHLQESRVGVEHRDAQRRAGGSGARAIQVRPGGGEIRHRDASVLAARDAEGGVTAVYYRIFTAPNRAKCADQRGGRRRTATPSAVASSPKSSQPPASRHQPDGPATNRTRTATPSATA